MSDIQRHRENFELDLDISNLFDQEHSEHSAIKIKFLKELVTIGWKTGISCSKWMEE